TVRAVDAAGNEGTRTILVTYKVAGLTISNVVSSSGREYQVVQGLASGARAYIDRYYQYSDIPSFLKGATYIQTSFNDRYNKDKTFLSFDVNRAVTVYVVHDDLTPLPEYSFPVHECLFKGFSGRANRSWRECYWISYVYCCDQGAMMPAWPLKAEG
ncbi:MAG: hypothetical protein JRJ01_16020, partial [Deltaproteobacteria bacterium]|nr:hypothetical protein [Deltaproteobacteria bacterium]